MRPPEPDDVGVLRASPAPARTITPRPKHDGKPKIDPIFVKAVVGHIYAIHVVNDTNDYYALFRVEALNRGDRCTISWRFSSGPCRRDSSKTKIMAAVEELIPIKPKPRDEWDVERIRKDFPVLRRP